MYRKVLIAAIVMLLGISAQSFARMSGGVCSRYPSEGLFAFNLSLDSEDAGKYDVSRVEFAMPTVPESSLWSAQGPRWYYDHLEDSLNWDVSIAPMTETGVSWMHDLPMTAITWTAREPEIMRVSPNVLEFQIQTPAWGLPTDWSVLRVWNSSGDLICWYDVAPVMQPVPEPSSFLALSTVLGTAFVVRRRFAK